MPSVEAWARVSSMISPASPSGTLKSTRMKTRLLLRSMSRMVSLGIGRLSVVRCPSKSDVRATRVSGYHRILLSAYCLLPTVLLQAARHELHQVPDPARIAPLVVVPGRDLHAVPVDHFGEARVDDGGVRVAAK